MNKHEKQMEACFRFFVALLCLSVTILLTSCSNSNKEDYELQEKCAKSAAAMFNENFANNPLFPNACHEYHYNKKLNKCFMLLKYQMLGNEGSPEMFYNTGDLYDVNENKLYASYTYVANGKRYLWSIEDKSGGGDFNEFRVVWQPYIKDKMEN